LFCFYLFIIHLHIAYQTKQKTDLLVPYEGNYRFSRRDIRYFWIFLPIIIYLVLFSQNAKIRSFYGGQCTPNFIVDFDLFFFNKTIYSWMKLAPFQNPLFDIITAISYLFHYILPVAYSLYLLAYKRAHLDFYQFMFAFGLVSSISVIVQYALPTPPPWMLEPSGLPPEANFFRVDAMLNVYVFKSIYARSPLVCGAFPSLHTGWPAVVLFGNRPWVSKSFCVLHVAWIAFAAVYSLHHWIVDVLFGLVFGYLSSRMSRYVVNTYVINSQSIISHKVAIVDLV
jgi:membrane-associated phospholipid phosphatase